MEDNKPPKQETAKIHEKNNHWLYARRRALLLFASAEAQQVKKIPRIGYLGRTPLASSLDDQWFSGTVCVSLDMSRAKTFLLSIRYAEGKLRKRTCVLTAELLRLKLDIIVTGWCGRDPHRQSSDLYDSHCHVPGSRSVGKGFVASLARPGGNITGLSSLGADLPGKRLELLKEILPKLSHAAVLGTSTNPGNVPALKATKLAAGPLRVQLQFLDVLSPKDIETAFRAATKARVDAVIVLNSPINSSRRRGCRACRKKSTSRLLRQVRLYRGRRADELRRELY